MNICLHCGHHFEEIKVKSYDSQTGWAEEVCPHCGSDNIDEAERCSECDEWVNENNLVNGLCPACIEKHANDYETVKAYGADRKEAVEINGFLAWAFTPAEIEEILERELKNSGNAKGYAHTFATDDTDDFTEWLNERSEA